MRPHLPLNLGPSSVFSTRRAASHDGLQQRRRRRLNSVKQSPPSRKGVSGLCRCCRNEDRRGPSIFGTHSPREQRWRNLTDKAHIFRGKFSGANRATLIAGRLRQRTGERPTVRTARDPSADYGQVCEPQRMTSRRCCQLVSPFPSVIIERSCLANAAGWPG